MLENGRNHQFTEKVTWFLNNGDRWVGELRNGKDWNTTGYDKNGNIIGRIVEGVRQ